jgi:ATPase subunit of ABC transporter with duplicated ATPase domains
MHGTLAAHDIVKEHGPQDVLRGVSLAVRPGSRIGIVGPNGIGKTTLLRVLAGLDEPDSGSVVRSPPSLTVGYQPQEPDVRPDETLFDYLARRTGVGEAEVALDALACRLQDEAELAGAYADALERYLALGGADLAARAGSVCADVGLRVGLDATLGTLSGGEVARATLAALLLARFDVYLLDEPTNNLDAAGLARLERFVAGLDGGLVVVSHDRDFLDRTVNRILELEAETGRPREYAGGWREFEHLRRHARRSEEAAFDRYTSERRRFESLLHVRRDQARTAGPMADRRGTQALRGKVKQAERRLERLERVDKPWRPWELELAFARPARGGDVVAALEGAVVELPGFRLGPVALELRARDRLALLGANGAPARVARSSRARGGPTAPRIGRRRRRTRSEARGVRARRASHRAVRPLGRTRSRRRSDPAGQIRPGRE